MFERGSQIDRARFLFLTCCQDYFKNNEHRIVSHSMIRTETPLASRSDLQPYLPLVKGDFADLLTLSNNKTITRCLEYEDLVAHFADDPNFVDSLITIRNSGLECDFNFLTNGVIMPDLIGRVRDNVGQLAREIGCGDENEFRAIFNNIDFYEVRFDAAKIHKMNDHKMYLRNIISRVRKLDYNYFPTQDTCECGGQIMKGHYRVSYWKKEQKLPYFICNSCGIQSEPKENSSAIMNFVAGLS
ncbi:MAG: hypothetical protein ACTSP4_12150 [Candidatus Hodarchaeales archaeon]